MSEQSTETVESVRFKPYLINKAHCKSFALDMSKASRNGKFKRVSDDFYLRCEANLKDFIRSQVQRHPSVGVTLK